MRLQLAARATVVWKLKWGWRICFYAYSCSCGQEIPQHGPLCRKLVVFRTQQVVSSTGSDPWEIIFMTYRPKLHPITSTLFCFFKEKWVTQSNLHSRGGQLGCTLVGGSIGEFVDIWNHWNISTLKSFQYININYIFLSGTIYHNVPFVNKKCF